MTDSQRTDRADMWKLKHEYRAHMQGIDRVSHYAVTCFNRRASYFQTLNEVSFLAFGSRAKLKALIFTATKARDKAQTTIEKLRLRGTALKSEVLAQAYRCHLEEPLDAWELESLARDSLIPGYAQNDVNGRWPLTSAEQAKWLELYGEAHARRTEAECLQRAAHKVTHPDPITVSYPGHGVMA